MIGRETQAEDLSSRAIQVSMHVGLSILLAAGCFLIVRPFIPLIAWGVIIAIALYPWFRRLKTLLHERNGLAATVCTILMLAILIVPVVLLTRSLVEGAQNVAERIRAGAPVVPPPPPQIRSWPVVGVPLSDAWDLASRNLSGAVQTFAPKIKTVLPDLFSASAGVGLATLQCILSIIVAGVLLASAATCAKAGSSLFHRLFGDNGAEFEELASSTVRSVTTGIVGVALIQSACAGIGFLVAGLPGSGLWAIVFLAAAFLQLGGIVLVPAVIYMFAISSTPHAIIFTVWCVFVAVMDNILKPLLLGRGVSVPTAVVFLGAIGGFFALGGIGLFVGAVVLSVGYKLLLVWLAEPASTKPVLLERGTSAVSGS